MKKAIFLFNRSRHMLQPWLDAGYECWTFDGQLKNGVITLSLAFSRLACGSTPQLPACMPAT